MSTPRPRISGFPAQSITDISLTRTSNSISSSSTHQRPLHRPQAPKDCSSRVLFQHLLLGVVMLSPVLTTIVVMAIVKQDDDLLHKKSSDQIVSIMSEKEQRRLILLAKLDCYKLSIRRERENQTGAKSCQVTWDNMLCWDKALANTVTSQPCPNYVNGFNTHELATKVCTENATWWVNPDPGVKHEWTNFSDCVKPAINLSFHANHGDQLRLLYTIGYSFSLGALTVAVSIMLRCKRLHSKSNTLHINLFLAFMLRAIISFLKDILFVGNVGLAKDVKEGENGILQFVQDDPHWECKLLFTIFTYTVNACNMWIFAEALYLSMLVYWPLTTERRGVRSYVLLGWTLPLAFIIPWVVMKGLYENTFCWNIQHSPNYYWILKGSGIAVVGINFCMFLNISRKLFLKLRHTSQLGACNKTKYRKLAKFILVLIPLFGIMYIVFYVAVPSNFTDSDFNLVYLYVEMCYNSFQGFFLALLFCFLNEEVHGELKRAWYRYKVRRKDQANIDNSVLLVCVQRRKSSTFSTPLKPPWKGKNATKSLRCPIPNDSTEVERHDTSLLPENSTVAEIPGTAYCGDSNKPPMGTSAVPLPDSDKWSEITPLNIDFHQSQCDDININNATSSSEPSSLPSLPSTLTVYINQKHHLPTSPSHAL